MNVLAAEHAKLNVQLALSLREQIILRSMLTLVLTAAPALLSVLQEQSLRVNMLTDNEKIKGKVLLQDFKLVTDLSFFAHFLRIFTDFSGFSIVFHIRNMAGFPNPQFLCFCVNKPPVLPTPFYLFRMSDML